MEFWILVTYMVYITTVEGKEKKKNKIKRKGTKEGGEKKKLKL